MSDYRIYVEKYPKYRVEADSLRSELNQNLGLSISELRLVNVYDLFGFGEDLYRRSLYSVFGEVVTDLVSDSCDLSGRPYLAVEYLPGQFDQRAASAIDCVRLIDPEAKVNIKSSKLLIFDSGVTPDDMERIRRYYINAVESREKDLSVLSDTEKAQVRPVEVIEGLRDMTEDMYAGFCARYGLAMSTGDLGEVVRYFRGEGRDPYETELRILDTYWSDHCRHTTFTTEITDIKVDESFIRAELEESLDLYRHMRSELGRQDRSVCLMDLATIGARYLRLKGYLDDMEVSGENNACSIFVTIDVDGEPEKWLLQFKNETHNHPTEIEPFGGASTCLGGAIRDPLSGRSYVYQALRVTGAGNIYQSVADTLEGKLPQKVISKKAAAGYSSYGNQIGLATTHVREIYHPDYVAKRLEVGAVVGAVKADCIRREEPSAGDVILLLGGRTGRDGIGGATGSSKGHTAKSLETCSSEVQKGNAPEERKLSRLFRRPEVIRLIKKSNDFGAGGVSVAIGELADGLDIYLERVPVKYSGLNSTELAISESQERMAVVIEAPDMREFMDYCRQENIEATHVADVTDTGRMRMYNSGNKVVDLSREFIDSAGARHYTTVEIGAVEDRDPFRREVPGADLRERLLQNMRDDNVVSQKGLIEMFDSTIGKSTVLMPFGGATQCTESQVSVQKLPVGSHYTSSASIMAYGYNPFITSWSPYHGAAYAVIEAVSKVVAAGARYDRMRFSYQEYFERMTDSRSWGKPMAALLGALRMQESLHLPSIGGKDSMSGSFGSINVPPMLMAFGITMVDARKVISPEFKRAGDRLYLIRHTPLDSRMPDTEQLMANFTFVSDMIERGHVSAAYAIGFGGLAEAVAKMGFGNMIGARITRPEADLFAYDYGSILLETSEELSFPAAIQVGETISESVMEVNGVRVPLSELLEANTARFCSVYPDRGRTGAGPARVSSPEAAQTAPAASPRSEVVAYMPVFPGTNCDYDMIRSFEAAGARTTTSVFCNLEADDILRSISQMCELIRGCDILALSGGFSAGDEPDGSGKFIANVLNNQDIVREVHALLDRGGLIIGICNGFQALVKSGLLPYGRLGMVTKESPTLFRNDVNRHVSQFVTTRVGTVASPWLRGFEVGQLHSIPVSHGEGKFMVSPEMAKELFENGQVAFQYVDPDGNPTMDAPFNPNGSDYAIEGIISRDGRILGKMGHSERYDRDLMRNISGDKSQNLFLNAVNYLKGL